MRRARDFDGTASHASTSAAARCNKEESKIKAALAAAGVAVSPSEMPREFWGVSHSY